MSKHQVKKGNRGFATYRYSKGKSFITRNKYQTDRIYNVFGILKKVAKIKQERLEEGGRSV